MLAALIRAIAAYRSTTPARIEPIEPALKLFPCVIGQRVNTTSELAGAIPGSAGARLWGARLLRRCSAINES